MKQPVYDVRTHTNTNWILWTNLSFHTENVGSCQCSPDFVISDFYSRTLAITNALHIKTTLIASRQCQISCLSFLLLNIFGFTTYHFTKYNVVFSPAPALSRVLSTFRFGILSLICDYCTHLFYEGYWALLRNNSCFYFKVVYEW